MTRLRITCYCFFGLISTAALAAEPTAVKAPGTGLAGVTAHCDDWAVLIDGENKYENNVWGASPHYPYQQCLLSREQSGKLQYGWTWHWQGKAPSWVFSYPEIIVGWKPWGESRPTAQHYPVTIGDIAGLSIDYAVSLEASGDYNLAPEIWIVKEKPTQLPMAKPEQLITTEIMFWMDHTRGIQPAGNKVSEFTFGGRAYDLWLRQDHNNSGDTVSWTVYSLVSHQKQHSGSIDVIGLIHKLVELGYPIDTSEAIASIEFGNETLGRDHNSVTQGTTWVDRFDVSLTLR